MSTIEEIICKLEIADIVIKMYSGDQTQEVRMRLEDLIHEIKPKQVEVVNQEEIGAVEPIYSGRPSKDIDTAALLRGALSKYSDSKFDTSLVQYLRNLINEKEE